MTDINIDELFQTEGIDKLFRDEINSGTFEEMEMTPELDGIQSFNMTTIPTQSTDCSLASSVITFTKQKFFENGEVANITVVKTASYAEDNCVGVMAKGDGTCVSAKTEGMSGAIWTTTITISLMKGNKIFTTIKTDASNEDGEKLFECLTHTESRCVADDLTTDARDVEIIS